MGKVQIIALRKYFDKKANKEKLKHKLLGEYDSVEWVFKNLNTVVENIPQPERWNVYYTALNCKPRDEAQRRLRVFDSQSVVPFDVDNLDKERLEDYQRIFFELTKYDPSTVGTVFSGNGLQFIVGLDKPFTDIKYFDERRPHYKAICAEYDARLRKEGLPGDMDPSVWSPARILRLPGTENRKEKKGISQARMLQPNITPMEFKWGDIAQLPDVEEDHHVKDWNPKNEAQIDHKEIFKSCEFFKEVRDNPGSIREPGFYAAISILARMEEGRKRCHDLADRIRESGSDSSVAGYSFDDIERKVDAALSNSGPRTCKGIDNQWGKCKTCPHFRKISSPIVLKGAEFISTKDTGFHYWPPKGKPIPKYEDLKKFFDQKYHFKVLKDNGMVYVYENNHYRVFSKTEIKGFAQEHFRPLPAEKVRVEFEKFIVSCNLVHTDFFSSKINGFLNCRNGVVNLKTKELLPHSPDYGFRYILPFDYDTKATAPNFERFLIDIMNGDEQRINLLQEFGGFALSGDAYKYHKFLMLSGSGRNGKGTFVHILKKLAGRDNVSDVPLSKMGNENNKQLMEGKLFNFCDEINMQDFKDIGELKKMTGEGTILVKMMWNQPYQIDARAKLIFACNELPELSETNIAVRDRLLLVPFDNEYTEALGNVDYELKSKLENELPGILNVFLDGYDRLEKNGRFTRSVVVEDAVEDYMAQQNPVIQWLEENPKIVISPLNGRCTFVPTNDLYNEFSDWWLGKGKEKSLTQFSRLFTQAIPSGRNRQARVRNNGPKIRGYWDISLAQKTYDVAWNLGKASLSRKNENTQAAASKGPSVQI